MQPQLEPCTHSNSVVLCCVGGQRRTAVVCSQRLHSGSLANGITCAEMSVCMRVLLSICTVKACPPTAALQASQRHNMLHLQDSP